MNISDLARHSSMDLSEPSILPLQVRVTSTQPTLLSIIVNFVLYFSLHCEKRIKNIYLSKVVVFKHDRGIGIVLSLVIRFTSAPDRNRSGRTSRHNFEARLRGQLVLDAAACAGRALERNSLVMELFSRRR